MSRDEIRLAALELLEASRAAQGLPRHIDDDETLIRVAAALRGTDDRRSRFGRTEEA